MKNLLQIVTECIDNFARKENITRLAAIIGGEAVILHGIPRTTLRDKMTKYGLVGKKADVGELGTSIGN